MTLVLDRRNELAGAAGCHVFIAGVSLYKHLPGGGGAPALNSFGMKQLSSTALTAYKVYKWLSEHEDQLPVKLATIRLLLSPSAGEVAIEQGMAGLADPCSRQNFATEANAWRTDARSNDANVTLFYFAGHGVQREKDNAEAVMLMEDFGKPDDGTLTNTVASKHLFNGMAPTGDPTRKIARTQFYFVDACRIGPGTFNAYEWLNVPDVWGVEKSGRDDRVAPIYFAAIPGTKAYALKEQQTIFSEALIHCLNGTAGEAMEEDPDGKVNWRVTVHSLNRALTAQMAELNERYGADQDYAPGGILKDTTICRLKQPPQVEISLEIEPAAAAQYASLLVTDYKNGAAWTMPPPVTTPSQRSLDAGLYNFQVKINPPTPPYTDFVRTRSVMPPRHTVKARVE